MQAAGETFDPYAVEYRHDGGTWALNICATSEDDAMQRLQRAAAHGQMLGKEVLVIPAKIPGAGLFARASTWLANAARYGT